MSFEIMNGAVGSALFIAVGGLEGQEWLSDAGL
jgi:hypothetical protein